MSQKERQRYPLLQMVISGKITLKETGNLMGVPYRQAMKKKLKMQGAKGLVHGNRGRPSPKAFSREHTERILDLSLNKYSTFNDTHFPEKIR